jgi:hypothetical protein
MELQFHVPADVSFPQAIALAEEILALPIDPNDAVQSQAIAALLQTSNGARGFFVTFLTGDAPLADAPTASVIRALRSAPTIVADLMVKNLAMSTAMALTHQANGDAAQAAGSARVQARSANLITQLQLPELQTQLQQLQASLPSEVGGEYADFLTRWGYDTPQRQAIAQAIAPLLPAA